jgi:hypothetical protein
MGLIDQIISVESGGKNAATRIRLRLGLANLSTRRGSTCWRSTGRTSPGSRDELLALKSDPALSKGDDGGLCRRQCGHPIESRASRHGRLAISRAFRRAAGRRRHPERRSLGAGRIDPRRGSGEGQSIPCQDDAGDLAAWADRKMGGNAAPMSMAGPQAAPAAPTAPMSLAPPQAAAKPRFQIAGSGASAPAPNLAALTATPQLTNLLPQRPNPFNGLACAVFVEGMI